MTPSSILCRAQEAQQRARAAATTLNNVRDQAMIAAAAWNKEALAADRREARKALRLAVPGEDERAFSENPDRGFA
jgi:hypothetical protein